MHFFVVAGAIFFLIMFVSSPNTRDQNNSLLDDGHRRHWTKLTLTKQRNINLNTKSFSSVPALLCIFVLHTASMYLFCLGNWEYMHGVVGWHNVRLYTIYADKYQATIYLYLYVCASVWWCDRTDIQMNNIPSVDDCVAVVSMYIVYAGQQTFTQILKYSRKYYYVTKLPKKICIAPTTTYNRV